jgi:adenylate cyclase
LADNNDVFRVTISKKLSAIFATIILGMACAVYFSAQIFFEHHLELLNKKNLDTAVILSGRIQAEVKTWIERAQVVGAASLEEFRFPEDRIEFIRSQLSAPSDQNWVLGLAAYHIQNSGSAAQWESKWRVTNLKSTLIKSYNPEAFDKEGQSNASGFASAAKGNIKISFLNANSVQVIRIAIPFVKEANGTFSQVLVLDVATQAISSLFKGFEASVISLVDSSNRILATSHPEVGQRGDQRGDQRGEKTGEVLSKQANLTTGEARQIQDNDWLMAASPVNLAGLSVLVQLKKSDVLAKNNELIRRILFLCGFFLAMALGVAAFFSKSISRPIQWLSQAASKVKRGDFTVRLNETRLSSGKVSRMFTDEIGRFTQVFNQMVEGLAERDKLKSTFSKFHNIEVVEALMKSPGRLGGERMEATVLFTDLRGFTSLSEKLDAADVVRLLNRYLGVMVQIILKNNGIVDKFIGDSILAVWGVPQTNPQDTANALRACLDMRRALVSLNRDLQKLGHDPLIMGMGIHRGMVVAGTIGSDERMEYTVIGDTVNTSNRIETVTKDFGCDVLVTESVVCQFEGEFIFEKAGTAALKGKSGSHTVFRVLGYRNFEGKNILVQTPYSQFDPGTKAA